jgi:hypothetical protein
MMCSSYGTLFKRSLVRDADGVERAIRHDRELKVGETVQLVLDEGDSAVRVLDT